MLREKQELVQKGPFIVGLSLPLDSSTNDELNIRALFGIDIGNMKIRKDQKNVQNTDVTVDYPMEFLTDGEQS